MRAYAGIGSRETPEDVQQSMSRLAAKLAEQGWTLRSGCAQGADTAFECGAWQAEMHHPAAPRPELYLPWSGFSGRSDAAVTRTTPQAEAFPIAEQFHPRWATLKQGAQKLHARNVHQIFGPDVTTPQLSCFVVCWTKDGLGGGGTGQALRIARHYNIPVFDLALNSCRERLQRFLVSE